MELVMEIKVYLGQEFALKGKKAEIKMLHFTGTTEGKYFKGKVMGCGVDTQVIRQNDGATLSARYMLIGKDYTGSDCKIFIENNGSDLNDCKPFIVTDSEALGFLEEAELSAKITPLEDKILVSVYRRKS